MKIAIAQMNCTVGDLAGNAAKIADFAQRAKAQGAQLLLTPELSLCGYPPEDLLLREGFYQACDEALAELAKQAEGIVLLVGHPQQMGRQRFNAVSILRDGKVAGVYHKHSLPNHSVFDEARYFEQGDSPCVIGLNGIRFGINVCADVWHKEAAMRAKEAGAEVLLVLNASPYHFGKQATRYEKLRERIGETGLAVIYANLVGGQDELVFDGCSFAMDAKGRLTHQLPAFDEALGMVEVQAGGVIMPGECHELPRDEASIYRALCVGVRDYIHKNGFPGVLIGLSGGIDSALTLAIAVDALGANRVRAVMMPSPYTSAMSLEDAREMARLLGVHYEEIPITPVLDGYLSILQGAFAGRAADTTEENIQARIRGNILMALSNKFGSLVLTTGNKSEMTVGYCTLYGDMAGGFAVLKDVSKHWVYRLAKWRNAQQRVIPERVITRPPSAELRPDQTDQDSLPPYEVLDAIMTCYVERNMSIPAIVAQGYVEADVHKVVRLIRIAEYKRRQAPVGVRITERGFGKDWRYPITVKYQDAF